MIRRLSVLGLAVLAAAGAALAQQEIDEARLAYNLAHYSKFEYRIPMRDGAKLFTVVYVPNDAVAGGGPYPILLFRTPYGVGPYGAGKLRDKLGPHAAFEKAGYIFALQDVRGRFMSEGEYVNMRPQIENKGPRDVDESTDTFDTIDYLLAHVEHHNGKVGQWGISYPGFYTAAGAIDSHPALAAVSPQAPIADWFWDDMHHHGAFILPLAFRFFARFGVAHPGPFEKDAENFDFLTPDGYQFYAELGPLRNANPKYLHGEIEFWNQITQHPNYDEFWQSRNLLPHLKNVKAAVMTVGGWFDAEDLYGPLHIYRAIEKNNPKATNVLVMGPWSHGGWVRTDGDVLNDAEFGFATSAWYQEHVDLPFFERYLKGQGGAPLPEALVFETGANRWREFPAWPPPGVEKKELYLGADGTLSFAPPTVEGEVADEYLSDPAKPVPYTQEITTRWAKGYMAEDQRFAARRPDVLVYRSEPLEEDLTIAGPMTASLWVSTTGNDADWIVKVIDELPGRVTEEKPKEDADDRGGTQLLVRGEVLRGRFRTSYEHPEPFEPNRPTAVAFELQDVFHTFARGHRLMVQIQSTWFPLVDRNPQTFVPNIFEAKEDDFVRATHRVYRSREYPSGVVVGVLP